MHSFLEASFDSKNGPGRLRAIAVSLLATLTLALLAASPAHAAPPEDFQTTLIQGNGLNGPSGFEIAPDGRVFILERAGKIKILKDGHLLSTPFADLPSEDTGDRGLIGIAFDPDFGVSNHYVYFYYTGHDLLNHLVRFSADGDVGTDGPYELFRTSSPSTLLHVGGSIQFGPDGKLYFAVGDNGDGSNAQNLSNPHGKILRINKDGSIPSDNPFAGDPTKLGAIWAYGMRNPWRFQFDSVTGRLYDGDVGNFSWEELNRIVKGGNYGWPLQEGMCQTNCAGFINPTYTWAHDNQSAAVTAGPVYRGDMFPDQYQGRMFFGDYAKGFIKTADLDGNGDVAAVQSFDDQAGSVVDFKVAPDGSLYYLTYYPGALYRITYNTTSHLPVANASADITKGPEPLTVQFSSAGSTDADADALSYEWTFGDGTSSTEANPTHTYTQKGVHVAQLTVSANGDVVAARPIVIQVGIPPTLLVSAPTEGQMYRAGDTVMWNAFAHDAAGFDLNDADIRTVVRLHHGTHFHPFLGPISGRAGSFTIPTAGEASADTSYEITVTATDSAGVPTSKTVNIFPYTSNLTFATTPPNLGLKLDSIPINTPYTVAGVEGFKRNVAAPDRAVADDGTVLQFAGWSDGKAARHSITTPQADTTYTANYVPLEPFTGKYYDNTTFSGAPVVTREDPEIDFDWGSGAPDPLVPANDFAVRWTTKQWFAGGRYTFTTKADDGVRLYIDGTRVLDRWQGPANTEFSATVDLGEGEHDIKLEYIEYFGGAAATLKWDFAPDQPADTWAAQYWNIGAINAIPDREADLTRDEDAVDHEWGAASPDPSITENRFAARWSRTLAVAPGNYEFTVTGDDGLRLYVDGVRVIDKWIDEGPTTYRTTLPLDGGPHNVVLEYYENGGGATAKLAYHRVEDVVLPGETPVGTGANTPYYAEFWNTPDATGPPAIPTTAPDLSRQDDTLDFDWGDDSPGAPVNSNLFVARWTKTVTLSAGLYRFSGMRDDGIRAYIDGIPVVDQWTYGRAAYSVEKVVLGGTHVLRVEAFEAGGGAQAAFSYERVGDVPATSGEWTGDYFDNRDLTGPPALTRTDDAIDFDWGSSGPAGVGANNFSVRWTKTFTVGQDGAYKFTVTSDDGVRLYVDGQKVIDKWSFQSRATNTVSYTLPAGAHQLVLEYFDATGDAVAKFDYQPTTDPAPPLTAPGEPYTAQYFANRDLSGEPLLTRDDVAIDFDWGYDGPGGGVPADNFSARWTKAVNVAVASSYKFTITADDGVRLFVDGQKVLDKWGWSPQAAYTVTQYLEPGTHQIVLEYFEAGGGAVAKLTYETTADAPPPPPPPPTDPFTAEYFDNQNLAGNPVLTRTEDAIDFDWGTGSPNFAVPFNQFSARWTRTKTYAAGTYRFTVTGDDGIRVLVDGEPVVNGWFYQAATTYTADVPLTEGEHTVTVEYFEFSGGAVAKYSETKVA